MKPLNFSRNSWHYKLAKIGGLRVYDWEGYAVSICDYTTKVIVGLIKFLVGFIVFTALSICLMDAIIWTIVYVSHGFTLFNMHFTGYLAACIITVSIILGIMTVLAYCITHLQDKISENISEKSHDNFITNAYDSLKNKFCVPVTFSEDRDANH